MRRAWWRRLWTVQEVVLNKSVDIFAGKENFEFKTFIRACMAWDSLDYIESANAGGQNEAAMINFKVSVQEVSAKVTLWIERHLMGRKQASMADMVRYCTIFDVKDPRDRIYALLGMTGHVTGFAVDYTKTTAEVYAEFAKAMLEAGRVDILRNAMYSGDSSLSWVPDWQRHDRCFLHAELNNASLGASAAYKFSHDLRILTLDTVAYDTVADVGPADNLDHIVATATAFWGRNYCESMSVCESVFRWSQADESNGKRISSDLLGARDLVVGFASDLAQNYPDAMRSLRLQHLDSGAQSNEIIRMIYNSAKNVPAASQGLPESDFSFSAYKRNKEALVGGRYFFMTRRGLLGRAAVEVNPGDDIYIVLGLGVPIAMRKVGQHFVIIGECFILGLMDGEGMHELRIQKVEIW
jgi:hypothetical protein